METQAIEYMQIGRKKILTAIKSMGFCKTQKSSQIKKKIHPATWFSNGFKVSRWSAPYLKTFSSLREKEKPKQRNDTAKHTNIPKSNQIPGQLLNHTCITFSNLPSFSMYLFCRPFYRNWKRLAAPKQTRIRMP